MTWLLLLATASLAADGDCFFPGRGPELVCIDAGSRVGGMPVGRSGAVLVRADDPARLGAVAEVAEIELLGGYGDVVRLHLRPGADDLALSRLLHGRADVAWSHPDLVVELVPHAVPDDPLVGEQWHLENTGQWGLTPGVDVNAETAWAVANGEGQIVAVLDSGVDEVHPDLVVHLGYDYVDGDWDSNPDLESSSAGHGTAVAGLAAAIGDNQLGVAGVAWGAEVYGIRLIGGPTTIGDIYTSFAEAVDAGATVLNNSWGWEGCPEIPMYAAIRDAMEYALDEGRGGYGAAVVISAGNDNCDIAEDGFQAHEAVTSVAASNGHDERESYSCFGELVDLSAPSGGVLTTDISGDGGYGNWDGDTDYWGNMSGTSASAPIVSGVYALMFSANDRLTALDAQAILCETAERIDVVDGEYDTEGWSTWYGCGRVDAGAAVLAVANQGPPLRPEILGPPGEVPYTRVVLEWSASDPDGDRLVHELWARVDQEEPVEDLLDGTRYELTGQVAAGSTVTWQVRSWDPWGPGEWTDLTAVAVTETRPRDELPSTCASGGWLVPWAPLILLGLRRRQKVKVRG